MRITLVVDNMSHLDLKSEHGLSFLVESDSGAVLFDVGQTDAWLENLRKLRSELPRVDAVALSHGHYDHAGGLGAAVKQWPHVKLYAHPGCFARKYARSEKGLRYIGVPPDVSMLEPSFRFNDEPVELLPGVTLSGRVELRTQTDVLLERFVVGTECGEQLDTFEDEQCLIVRGDSGVAVLVGCSHRGVENNLLAGMEVAGSSRVKLLTGGFHLAEASAERLDQVADLLGELDVESIVCCHCTGMHAYEVLRDRLGSRVTLGYAGMSWDI